LSVKTAININPEVSEALAEGRPVVALETAVLTHGLPRTSLGTTPRLISEQNEDAHQARKICWGSDASPHDWDERKPVNLEVARLVESTVRSQGGVPATIAVIEGILRIGLDEESLEGLASMEGATKCSTRELGMVMARGGSGGTTVAGTLASARAANQELRDQGLPPIEVFATGGIGGVHRNWNRSGDISSDIFALAETRMVVVSAGAKVILDLPATQEAFETQRIPVLGWLTDRFPQFTAAGLPGARPLPRFDRLEDVAATCRAHWALLDRNEGVLLANEIPKGLGLDPEEVEIRVLHAISDAEQRGIRGADLTPFLLGSLAESTDGEALDSNISLLCSNAALATRLAGQFMEQA
jgi:pseudouridine-5'-phosphate glycosidase